MVRIFVFASGSGTNAENIIDYFKNSNSARVTCVLTNNKRAGVLKRAERLGVPAVIFTKEEMKKPVFLKFLQAEADLIVLAGFLLKVPETIVQAFKGRIINIHPALLPKYGGKGMYGKYVHEAVVANREKESGITIHYVNEKYDDGAVIFQKSVALSPEDTPDDVAEKIHRLEQENFPKVIEQLITSL